MMMIGASLLLNVALLMITLIDHCVWASPVSVAYDQVKLSANNSGIDPVKVDGKSYPTRLAEKLSSCCLVFGKSCDFSVSLDTRRCSCTVVYRNPMCTDDLNSLNLFAQKVQLDNGSAVVFEATNPNGVIETLANEMALMSELLRIPVIFVQSGRGSNNFYAKLKDESNLMVRIEVTGQGSTTPDEPTTNGFNNARSATTFYFVVFAFTILLLLSLTWFVFNYLRRCHHMYTVKRQRVSELYSVVLTNG